MTRIELFSSLPPAECAARLRAAVDRWDFGPMLVGLTGSSPVVGRVGELSFCLRKRISYNNSFQPRLRGTMNAEGDGTAISATVAETVASRIVTTIWLGFLGLVGCILIVGAVLAQNDWINVVPPVAMYGLGWCIFRFCRWLARDEAEFLTNFLIETLDAEPRTVADPYEAIAG